MKTAVLLIQLGTPDAPTPEALRPYLRQFLSDPRVVDDQSWLWWFILNFRILYSRPAESAAKYARIWDRNTGSPLMHHTRRQVEELRKCLPRLPIEFGMQVGNPSAESVLQRMIKEGTERLIVFP